MRIIGISTVLRGETYPAVSLCALFDMPPVEIPPEGFWVAVFVQSPVGKACFLAEAMQKKPLFS